jgi:hypothetical protein
VNKHPPFQNRQSRPSSFVVSLAASIDTLPVASTLSIYGSITGHYNPRETFSQAQNWCVGWGMFGVRVILQKSCVYPDMVSCHGVSITVPVCQLLFHMCSRKRDAIIHRNIHALRDCIAHGSIERLARQSGDKF